MVGLRPARACRHPTLRSTFSGIDVARLILTLRVLLPNEYYHDHRSLEWFDGSDRA